MTYFTFIRHDTFQILQMMNENFEEKRNISNHAKIKDHWKYVISLTTVQFQSLDTITRHQKK